MSSYISYEKKYIKYKLKYTKLKVLQLIKSQQGGGIKSAQDYFYAQINKNYRDVYSIFNNDNFLKDNISNFILPRIDEIVDKSTEELASVPIFIDIFNFIESQVRDVKIIDYTFNMYLNNGLGSPNTLENISILKNNIKKFNLLKDNKENDEKTLNKKTFPSLTKLKEYIDSKEANFIEIKEREDEKKIKKEDEIKKKELGEAYVIVQLKTDKVIIYTPTTKNGSIYYGRNTKWCTTATDPENMFDTYNSQGPLYIIQSKYSNTDKYQLHFETESFENSAGKQVNLSDICDHFDDNKLSEWIRHQIIIKEDLDKIRSDDFNSSLDFLESPFYKNITHLIIGDSFNQPLNDFLLNLTNLKTLTFGHSFNQPLAETLVNLTNLETLTFGYSFDQPLGNSLLNLNNLKTLTFDDNFDQPLGGSLLKLPNLEILTFGEYYMQPINYSLSNLRKLHTLTFGYSFDESLGDFLSYLTNLKALTFGDSFNRSLEDSLLKLTNLKTLTFGDMFNQPLGDSLLKLTNLEELTFGARFNQPLGNSLLNLTNLEELTFGEHNIQLIDDSLSNLRKLRTLVFGYNYDYNNTIDSLLKLPNLKNLLIGKKFNEHSDYMKKFDHLDLIGYYNNEEDLHSYLTSLRHKKEERELEERYGELYLIARDREHALEFDHDRERDERDEYERERERENEGMYDDYEPDSDSDSGFSDY